MLLNDALAARKAAVPFAGAADATLPDDYHGPAPCSALPPDATAIIHCPAPSVMSSGRRGSAEWVLEFAPRTRPFIEPLMGWTGGTDTLRQVRLHFPTREAAIGYARRQELPHEVREPTHIQCDDLSR